MTLGWTCACTQSAERGSLYKVGRCVLRVPAVDARQSARDATGMPNKRVLL